jgi:hypothetical protein
MDNINWETIYLGQSKAVIPFCQKTSSTTNAHYVTPEKIFLTSKISY